MNEHESGVARLRRLTQIKQVMTEAAEAAVRDAEQRLARAQQRLDSLQRQIRAAQAEIAQQAKLSGARLQLAERYLHGLESKQHESRQDLENATQRLEETRFAWVEARRAQRTFEITLARRLHAQQRKDATEAQKAVDDRHLGQLARSRLEE